MTNVKDTIALEAEIRVLKEKAEKWDYHENLQNDPILKKYTFSFETIKEYKEKADKYDDLMND